VNDDASPDLRQYLAILGRRKAIVVLVTLTVMVVSVVVAHVTLPETARNSYDQLMGHGSRATGFTGWFWTCAVCSAVALVAAALAVRWISRWPEMGSRYDAPGAPGAPGAAGTTSDQAIRDPDRELWHALDEGRDPTDSRS